MCHRHDPEKHARHGSCAQPPHARESRGAGLMLLSKVIASGSFLRRNRILQAPLTTITGVVAPCKSSHEIIPAVGQHAAAFRSVEAFGKASAITRRHLYRWRKNGCDGVRAASAYRGLRSLPSFLGSADGSLIRSPAPPAH